MNFLRKHLFFSIGAIIAASIMTASFVFNMNLFDSGLKELLRLEGNKLDELATAVLVVIIGLSIDHVRARRLSKQKSAVDAQRLWVMQATMRSVLDLVNNFLNNMQLFRLEGEDGPLSAESLKLFDDLIFETAEKLKALSESESVVEYKMASGIGILPDNSKLSL